MGNPGFSEASTGNQPAADRTDASTPAEYSTRLFVSGAADAPVARDSSDRGSAEPPPAKPAPTLEQRSQAPEPSAAPAWEPVSLFISGEPNTSSAPESFSRGSDGLTSAEHSAALFLSDTDAPAAPESSGSDGSHSTPDQPLTSAEHTAQLFLSDETDAWVATDGSGGGKVDPASEEDAARLFLSNATDASVAPESFGRGSAASRRPRQGSSQPRQGSTQGRQNSSQPRRTASNRGPGARP